MQMLQRLKVCLQGQMGIPTISGSTLCVPRSALKSQSSSLNSWPLMSFNFLFQYEYFNAVLINERDKDGNFLELGKEFILAPNDHFNNLPVNISLSDVQVPTNMYNKGETPPNPRSCSH